MSAPVTDPIEELLAAALADARTDDRWAIAPKAQAMTSVRRAATRQRTRNAGLALAGIAVGSVGGIAVLASLGDGGNQVVLQPGNPGASPAPSPVAGISPEWTPRSGADWMLDKDEYDAFVSSHTLPSPAPHGVQSPAPLTERSARLAADAERVLPAGSTIVRQDAPDGLATAAALHVHLADGTPLEVRREPLQQPISSFMFGDGQPHAVITRRDLATGSVLVSIAHTGYGWGPGIDEGANTAVVISAAGLETTWNGPMSIPLDTIAQWAAAADNG
jgi:hypothetical protein